MQELADYLKSERLKQGLTLPAMSERLRVSVSMLQSLEEGDFERVGTPLLIRSFVRGYCECLGIDCQPLLEKYASEIVAVDRQDEGIQRYGKWSKGLRKKSRIGIFGVVLFGIAVVGIVYGGAWFWKFRLHSGPSKSLTASGYPQQDLPSDLSDNAVQGPRTEAVREAPMGADKAVRPAKDLRATDILPESLEKPSNIAPTTEKHQLTVEASLKTWVQVTTDDKNTLNVMLEPGDKRQWEAEKTMRIVVGNAGGVRMKWDGRPVDLQAKPGSVVRFSLPDQRYVKD
jgi:cytoskeleton protein RodZ